jgi:hypothetical protein
VWLSIYKLQVHSIHKVDDLGLRNKPKIHPEAEEFNVKITVSDESLLIEI